MYKHVSNYAKDGKGNKVSVCIQYLSCKQYDQTLINNILSDVKNYDVFGYAGTNFLQLNGLYKTFTDSNGSSHKFYIGFCVEFGHDYIITSSNVIAYTEIK